MACVMLRTKNKLESSDLKKWISVDQSAMIDAVQPVDEFVSTIGKAVAQLTHHPHAAIVQSKFSRICVIP